MLPALPDISHLRLIILNERERAGEASAWEKRFTDAGFNGASIGNAQRREHTGVTISCRHDNSTALFPSEMYLRNMRNELLASRKRL